MRRLYTRAASIFLVFLLCLVHLAPMASAASTYTEVKIACTKCAGTGKKVCSICKGTGIRKSSKCYLCKGSGRRGKCSSCKGCGYTIDYASTISEYQPPEENTFAGTINDKEVVGYLDDTYQYRIDGSTDYNGAFVIYDSKGTALYKLAIRIDKGSSAKTYTNGSSAVSVSYYTALSKECKWGSTYTTATSDDWTITLSEVNDASDGVFKGTMNAVLKPAKYGGEGLEGEVRISGAFCMQMQEVHSVAREYRRANLDYDTANPHNFYQSYSDTNSSSDSSTDSSSGSSTTAVDHTCRTCKGSGRCGGCAGRGWKISSASGKVIDCVRCKGTGRCQVCYGTGKVY